MKSEKKSVEFFMMLTNRSILLSKYTIGSYNKVYKLLHDKYDIRLTCYLNAINMEKYGDYLRNLSNITLPFLNLVHGKYLNTDFEWTGTRYRIKGSDKMYPLPMVTPAEGQDEYFQKTTADYFVTVDDDFEILNPEFVEVLLDFMDKNQEVPCVSTDCSIKSYGFDRYSNGYNECQPRNCTWFCIYRVSRRIPVSMCVVDGFFKENGEAIYWKGIDSDISWEEYEKVFRNEKGLRKVWDNGGWLQEIMRDGRPLVSLNDLGSYSKQYIHYAAFASNSSINTPLKTSLYRFLMIQALTSDSKFKKRICRYLRKHLFPCKERRVTNQKSALD